MGEHSVVLTLTRRLVPVLVAGLLLVPQAAPVAAASTPEAITDAVLAQSATDLVALTNQQRVARGLVAVQIDPDIMAVARMRAQVMAANDMLSHTEPGGQSAFSRLSAGGVGWYAAAEIILWNTYSTEKTSVEAAIKAWMASSGHRAIMLSANYNYVGFGAAVSASGKRYYAGVFVKQRDETGAWAKLGSVSRQAVDGGHVRLTFHWTGGDPRLQVLTSGFRLFQLQARQVGRDWASWGKTTATRRSVTWSYGVPYEFRVRSLDNAGNYGAWKTLSIIP